MIPRRLCPAIPDARLRLSGGRRDPRCLSRARDRRVSSREPVSHGYAVRIPEKISKLAHLSRHCPVYGDHDLGYFHGGGAASNINLYGPAILAGESRPARGWSSAAHARTTFHSSGG